MGRRGHPLELGMGVAMGFATCGQIDFDGRDEYTAIGTLDDALASEGRAATRRQRMLRSP